MRFSSLPYVLHAPPILDLLILIILGDKLWGPSLCSPHYNYYCIFIHRHIIELKKQKEETQNKETKRKKEIGKERQESMKKATKEKRKPEIQRGERRPLVQSVVNSQSIHKCRTHIARVGGISRHMATSLALCRPVFQLLPTLTRWCVCTQFLLSHIQLNNAGQGELYIFKQE
jgi:hypothetical protein